MNGLAIFLTIILALLVVLAIILVTLVISISHKIAKTQQSVKLIHQRIVNLTDIATIVSSISALVGVLLTKSGARRKERGSEDREGSSAKEKTDQ